MRVATRNLYANRSHFRCAASELQGASGKPLPRPLRRRVMVMHRRHAASDVVEWLLQQGRRQIAINHPEDQTWP
jgi:hypothetical protein